MVEKTYRLQNLVLTYMPSLVQLLGYKFDWVSEDIKFENRLLRRQSYLERNGVNSLDTASSFYDLLLKAFDGDIFTRNLFQHMNNLLIKILDREISFESDIRTSFLGKFNNLDGLNYLNPFGEISFMYDQIFNKGNRVIAMEHSFPNGKPKDFLIELNGSGTKMLYEVLNLHCKLQHEASDAGILNDIIEKTRLKILSETKGLDVAVDLKIPVSFVVVLWHADLDFLRRNMDFFDQQLDSIVPSVSTVHPINNFYTYVKIDGGLKFIEVSSLK